MDRNGVFRLGCFLKPQVPKSTRIMTNVQYWPRITSCNKLQWHHALGNIQILYSCSHIYWLKIHLMLVKLSTPSFCWSLSEKGPKKWFHPHPWLRLRVGIDHLQWIGQAPPQRRERCVGDPEISTCSPEMVVARQLRHIFKSSVHPSVTTSLVLST